MVNPPRTILVATIPPGNFSVRGARSFAYWQLSNTQSLQVQPVSSQLQPSPR